MAVSGSDLVWRVEIELSVRRQLVAMRRLRRVLESDPEVIQRFGTSPGWSAWCGGRFRQRSRSRWPPTRQEPRRRKQSRRSAVLSARSGSHRRLVLGSFRPTANVDRLAPRTSG